MAKVFINYLEFSDEEKTKFKMECVKRGVNMQRTVEEIIKEYLNKEDSSEKAK